MENASSAVVGDVMIAGLETISPNETITVARRRMESQTARSLIVVEGDRPVGVIQWRGLSGHEGSVPVRDVMLTEFPILRSDMPVDEARPFLIGADIDLDHLPVVDSQGALIGEVQRGVLTKGETATTGATQQVIGGPEAGRDTPLLQLEQGMKVLGVSGKSLGTVDQVDISAEGQIAHFIVKHGMLGRKSKRLPVDVIRAVEGDEVHLTIDQMEFKMLADIGDEIT